MSTPNTPLSNVYDDQVRAEAYDSLEFPGTYYLAFRDLPALFEEHVRGTRALDFGCGAGRSTRFLKRQGFDPVGLDVSAPMVACARERDPRGDYRLMPEGDFSTVAGETFDLVLSAFTFDNVPMDHKVGLFQSLRNLLAPRGRLINLVSSEAIYVHEWASFSTRDFPENRSARVGDRVRIVMLDVQDRRPVEDAYSTDGSYREVYRHAGLDLLSMHSPLGTPDEPYPWVSETSVSPWAIYVLRADRED